MSADQVRDYLANKGDAINFIAFCDERNFSVTGNAQIVGVDNANPVSLESCQLPQRKVWKGRCLLILKAGKTPGQITVQAKARGWPRRR